MNWTFLSPPSTQLWGLRSWFFQVVWYIINNIQTYALKLIWIYTKKKQQNSILKQYKVHTISTGSRLFCHTHVSQCFTLGAECPLCILLLLLSGMLFPQTFALVPSLLPSLSLLEFSDCCIWYNFLSCSSNILLNFST